MNLKYFIAATAIVLSSNCSKAQTGIDTAQKSTTKTLPEFIYSANKFKEQKRNIVQPVMVLHKKDIRNANVQNTATLLEQTGNVFVQRSQAGGGSPVIRGIEASRILLVIDGVRMNNAIYRTGHLQNLITIDNNILQSLEVIYGPASTLYGSDALGGVVVMNTATPKFNSYGGSAFTRYSSVNNEGTAHVDFSIGGNKLASLTSVTYSNFGDTRQGAFRNPFYGDFGARNEFITRINGIDSIVKNEDNNVQKYSGYSQVDLLEKIVYKSGPHTTHTLNLQYSNSSNIPRYDRLTDIRNGKLRFAEWYYGPQQRLMGAYHLNIDSLTGLFNEIKATASYQNIEESRYQRNYRNNRRQERIETVDVAGFSVDGRKFLGKHNEITAGIDGQYNNVRSVATSRDIVTNATTALDTRYPDGGSNMTLAAVYAQHLWKIIPGKLVVNDGVRLSYTQLNAKFNTKEFFPFPFSDATQQNTAVSGNLGIAYMPGNRWRIALGGSTGFRSPNVDDLAKVFESAGAISVVVPNSNLKPEYTYNADLNVSYTIADMLKAEVDGFYTWFDNAIVVDKYTFNGRDSILYNGANTAVAAAQNKANAYIYGFSSSLSLKCNAHLSLYGGFTYTYGRYNDAAGKETPLDHIPPVYGKAGLIFTQSAFRAEAFTMFNGWKRLQDYSQSGEDNLTYATTQGMPAWYTLNIKASQVIARSFTLSIALENILDYNYRNFASGISAPGRNLVIAARYRL